MRGYLPIEFYLKDLHNRTQERRHRLMNVYREAVNKAEIHRNMGGMTHKEFKAVRRQAKEVFQESMARVWDAHHVEAIRLKTQYRILGYIET